MLPLMLATVGEENIIKKIEGDPEMKSHLEDLGFSVGARATVVSTLGGDVVVKVRETKVAISRETAQRILV